MQRNHQVHLSTQLNSYDLLKQTAFHEAGHAAAIYIGNQNRGLPQVFFQIAISENPCLAHINGGQLIQNLPVASLEYLKCLNAEAKIDQEAAYQADIVNILVGPLAEAKYVAIRDNEPLNNKLLNFASLVHYGGRSDLEKASTYLEYFVPDIGSRDLIMLELFKQAYAFIDNRIYWTCILNLAHFILDSQQATISCEEAISVLDEFLLCC